MRLSQTIAAARGRIHTWLAARGLDLPGKPHSLLVLALPTVLAACATALGILEALYDIHGAERIVEELNGGRGR